MNVIDKYYMRKASLGMSDEFYPELEARDMALLRRAQIYLVVAPTMTMAIIYVLRQLRYELLMSSHFFHIIK